MVLTPRSPCGICHKNVNKNQKAIQCNECNFWFHAKCEKISDLEYKILCDQPDNIPWFCVNCTMFDRESTFPFGSLDNEDLLILNNLDIPSLTESEPSFEITSHLTNLPNLSDYDIDEQMPQAIDSRYFSLSELSSLKPFSTDLSIIHTNIRSLSLHFDELVSLSVQSSLNPDVIGVSEIWHSDNKPICTNVDIPGYTFYKTSSSSQNGGVGLYTKSTLNSVLRQDLSYSTADFETVWVEVDNKKDKNMLFCCVYRHPDTDIENITSHFHEILSRISNNKLIFILGDFNINLLNYDSHIPSNDFINTFFSHNLLPCIHHPSRISESSKSIIDNIFTNSYHSNITSGNILTQITDHFPQFLILSNSKVTRNKTQSLKYDYSKLKEDKFIEDFHNIDFTYLENENIDSNNKFDKLLTDLNCLSNKHAPIRRRTKKEMKLLHKPWINSRIQKMMKIRDKALHKMKLNKTESNITLFKKFRNRISNELKQNKASYYYNYFSENRKNIKKVWAGIKTVISHKSSSSTTVNKIKDSDGNVTSDSGQISNVFNDFFVNVANKITKRLPQNPKSPLYYLSNRTSKSFFVEPITHFEVYDIINVLNPSKSVGPYSIPVKLLKILSSSVSPLLASLANHSFQTGIFPEKLKTAKVIALFKKGDCELPSNYRPISLLSIFSKIFEKLMYKRLYKFLEIHNVLYSLQFGFQQNHSIDHALVSMTEDIRNTLDNKKFGCGIFIDLQKAFDTVNHQILLSKLEHYGIRGCALNWFRSYLSDRQQYVCINESNSRMMKITCGVPQGSVLGPLPFLIYINDLPHVSKKLKFYLFADDTNIYCKSDNLSNLVKSVNTELKLVKKWLDVNKLSLNIEKTNFIVFHSFATSVPADTIIKIGKKHIKKVKFVRFLGLLLDEHLSWKYHLSELSKKLARCCGMFFKIRNMVPHEVLICLYNALFLSFLQYGIIVWGQTFNTYLDPLFKIQKKTVRAISFQPPLSPSSPIFKDLQLLELSAIFRLKLLTFVFDSIHGNLPICFNNFFLLGSSVHQYCTRQANKGDLYLVNKNTLQYGLKSLRYLGAKLWNDVPVEIRNIRLKNLFKLQLKIHLQNL